MEIDWFSFHIGLVTGGVFAYIGCYLAARF